MSIRSHRHDEHAGKPGHVTGRIDAAFTRAGGRTQLSRKYHQYPLKIAKSFPFDHGQVGVYIMDASPGIMAGDRYELNFELEPDTRVYITNQSYTKVHPARRASEDLVRPSRQTHSIRVAAGAVLEYMPEPVMLYADAHLLSETEISIEQGGTLIYSELMCPGRTHRGELFRYDCFRGKVNVHYGGELIYCARTRIEPPVRPVNRLGAWGAYTHSAALYVFREGIGQGHVETLRAALQRYDSDGSMSLGISLAYKHGLILSALGTSVNMLEQLIADAWAEVRRQLLGLPPFTVYK
jgi:urease accessory protein